MTALIAALLVGPMHKEQVLPACVCVRDGVPVVQFVTPGAGSWGVWATTDFLNWRCVSACWDAGPITGTVSVAGEAQAFFQVWFRPRFE